jgi:hypothetical protein
MFNVKLLHKAIYRITHFFFFFRPTMFLYVWESICFAW